MRKVEFNYQQKFTLLLVLSAFMVLMTYEMAVKKTFYYINLSSQQEQIQPGANVSSADWARISEKEAAMTGILRSTPVSDTPQNISLLEILGKGCSDYNLKLEEVSAPAIYQDSAYFVHTSRIRLEGSFRNLLTLLDTLEKNRTLGKISSVDFKTFQNPNATERKLDCVFYLQNLTEIR